MKSITKKKTKVWLLTVGSVLLAAILVLSGIGIYLKLNQKPKGPQQAEVGPLDFSIDAWDGKTINGLNFTEDFAGRGLKTKTIDSASSFVYFVNEVNSGNTFEDYVVYLNKNIDLSGHKINSIGSEAHPFKGTFDGGYYTIFNANIKGNGLFGCTDGAEIKNVGLYNSTILTSEKTVGGLIGKAINTNISNSYIRLKEIVGSDKVGGLVGEYISSNGEHTIENSFVDTTINALSVAGLVHTVSTNNSSENKVTIKTSYYTSGDKAVEIVDNAEFVVQEKVIKPTSKNSFATWDYIADYDKGAAWCDYNYLEGSNKLDFNYPILSGFTKVFLTGSHYESVVVAGDKAVDFSNLSEAFSEIDKTATADSKAKVNLIVEKIFMEAEATVANDVVVTVNPIKDTTIIRGEHNDDGMFVSTGSSKIVLGQEKTQARAVSESKTLTLDGNKELVEKNNSESSALVVSYGAEVEIHENVVIKNNVNNTVGYGGAVFVYGGETQPVINATIENCHSLYGGGGVCTIGNAPLTLGGFDNCSSAGAGGAVAIRAEMPEAEAVKEMVKRYGNGKTIVPLTHIEYETNTTLKSGISNSSTTTSDEYTVGGAIYAECQLTIGASITFSNNSSLSGGGAIYTSKAIVFGNSTNKYTVTFTNNHATGGGAICYSSAVSSQTVQYALFSGNYATSTLTQTSGGAISLVSGRLTIGDRVTFDKNYVSTANNGDGGAVYASNVTISGTSAYSTSSTAGVTFSANYVKTTSGWSRGGAIRALNTVSFSGKVYIAQNYAESTKNQSDVFGGAIYATSVTGGTASSGINSYVTFYNNRVKADTSKATTASAAVSGGGAIFSGYVSLGDGVSFSSNKVENQTGSVAGGAIYTTGSSDSLNGVKFTGNNIISYTSAGYARGGAVAYVNSTGELDVQNCVFTGNSAHNGTSSSTATGYADGGAIHMTQGSSDTSRNTLKVYGTSSFTSNYTRSYADTTKQRGGAIAAMKYTYISLFGSPTFTGNGVYSASNDGTFSESEPYSRYGGAITIHGAGLIELDGTPTFENNKAYYGGAIYTYYAEIQLVGNSTFKENIAVQYGGALRLVDANLSVGSSNVQHATFEGNHVIGVAGGNSHGGAISLQSTKDISLKYLTFKGNHVKSLSADNYSQGGAIFFTQGYKLELVAAMEFTDNYVETVSGGTRAYAGAIKMENANSTLFVGGQTSFTNNYADYGGAIFSVGSVQVRDTAQYDTSVNSPVTFTGNHAVYGGGAIQANKIANCINCAVFDGNYVSNTSAGAFGGALRITNATTFPITQTVFKNNYAKTTATASGADAAGGAISLNANVALTITDTTFTNNHTESTATYSFGGAVYAGGTSSVTVSGTSSFTSNYATSTTGASVGGAIMMNSSTKKLVLNGTSSNRLTFTGNYVNATSGYSGGGAFEHRGPGVDGVNVELSYADFKDNYALAKSGAYGGAVRYNYASTASVSNCTFEGNYVQVTDAGVAYGGAIMLTQTTTFTVSGSTFKNNYTSNVSDNSLGGAICASGSSTVTINGTNTFQGNRALTQSGSTNGGAIYMGGSTGLLSINATSEYVYSTFDGNYCKGTSTTGGNSFGGAIGHNGTGTNGVAISVNGAVFTNNYLESAFGGSGGALRANSAAINMTGSNVFIGNSIKNTSSSATSSNCAGGAVTALNGFNADDATLGFQDNKIEVAAGSAQGGALYASATTEIKLTGATFTRNYTSTVAQNSLGGAIFVSNTARLNLLENNTFQTNRAITQTGSTNGGAIFMNNNTSLLSVQGATSFTGNYCKATDATTGTAYGGAIGHNGVGNDKGAISIGEATFTNNYIDAPQGGGGGAVRAQNGIINLLDYTTTFTGNYGKSVSAIVAGGAIAAIKGLDINGATATFKQNSVTSTSNIGNGGAVYTNGSVFINEDSTVEFEENSATSNGGAICLGGSFNHTVVNIAYSGATFKKNTATSGNGGAIYANVNIYSDEETDTINFQENKATAGNGGAIYGDVTILTPASSTFSLNSAKSGGAIYSRGSDGWRSVGYSEYYWGNCWEYTEDGYLGATISIPSHTGGYIIISDYSSEVPSFTLEVINGYMYLGDDGGWMWESENKIPINQELDVEIEWVWGLNAEDSLSVFVTVEDADGTIVEESGELQYYYGEYIARGEVSPTGWDVCFGGTPIENYCDMFSIKDAYYVNRSGSLNEEPSRSAALVFSGSNVTFSDNSATAGDGGAIYSTIGFSLYGQTFSGNTAISGNGGAIYASGATINTNGATTFMGNIAGGDGGAIYATTVTARGTYSSNSADDGGAIYATTVSSGSSAFSSNNAYVDGGAIYATTVNITASATFTENFSYGDGGAIHATTVNLNSGTTSFIKNYVQEIASGYGGAVYGDVYVKGGTANFTQNRADVDGGAICGDLSVSKNATANLTNNYAGGSGGGIYGALYGSGTANFIGNYINSGGNGSAICTEGDLILVGITLNVSGNLGGFSAIWCSEAFDVEGTLTLQNNTNAGVLTIDGETVTVTALYSNYVGIETKWFTVYESGNVTVSNNGSSQDVTHSGQIYSREGVWLYKDITVSGSATTFILDETGVIHVHAELSNTNYTVQKYGITFHTCENIDTVGSCTAEPDGSNIFVVDDASYATIDTFTVRNLPDETELNYNDVVENWGVIIVLFNTPTCSNPLSFIYDGSEHENYPTVYLPEILDDSDTTNYMDILYENQESGEETYNPVEVGTYRIKVTLFPCHRWALGADATIYVGAEWTISHGLVNFICGDTILASGYTRCGTNTFVAGEFDATEVALSARLPEMKKEGYTFLGWYTAVEGGTKVINADGILQANVTGWTDANGNWLAVEEDLYCRWLANEYIVTLDPNGGDVDPTKLVATYDTTYDESFVWNESGVYDEVIEELPDPTRKGYTFDGWYGKNLFDKKATPTRLVGSEVAAIDSGIEVTINSSSTNLNQNVYYSFGDFADFVGKQVTISLRYESETTDSIQVMLAKAYADDIDGDGDKLWQDVTTVKGSSYFAPSNTITFTTSVIEEDALADYFGVRIYWHITSNCLGKKHTLSNFQVEIGSTATTYEPYVVGSPITSESVVKTAGDHTLIARWTPNDYVVTYDANDGTINGSSTATQVVTYDSTYGQIENIYPRMNASNFSLSKVSINSSSVFEVNYTNTGTSNNYANFFSNATGKIKSGVEYTYVLEVLTWTGGTVTFETGHTNATLQPAELSSNSTTVSKAGTYFLTKIKSSQTDPTTLSRDFITIPAGVTAAGTFRVSLFAGKVTENNYSYVSGGSYLTVGTPTPSREGYTFDGWYGKNLFDIYDMQVVGGTTGYEVKDNVLTISATGTKGAQYLQTFIKGVDASKTYILSYKAKKLSSGGNSGSNIKVNVYGSNDDSTYTSLDSMSNSPEVGTEISRQKVVTGYSYYKFFLYNHASTPVELNEKTCYYDVQFEEGSTVTAYEPFVSTGKVESTTKVQTASDHTLYARWTPDTYDVEYNGNGSTSGEMDNQTFTYDVEQALTENAFEKSYTVTFNHNYDEITTSQTVDYTFNGWDTEADGTGDSYSDKQSVVNLTSEKGATINLYAQWTGGALTLPTPTREGYNFNGWNTASDGSGTTYAGEQTITITANTILYAYWTAGDVTVTVNHYFENINNNDELSPSNCALLTTEPPLTGIADSYITPAVKVVKGFTSPSTQTVKVNADGSSVVNYYYTRNSYDVTYNANGGTLTDDAIKTLDYGAPYGTVTNPARTGYTFAGWYGKNLLDINVYMGTTKTVVEETENSLKLEMSSLAQNTTPGSMNWSSGWIQFGTTVVKPNTGYTISYDITYLTGPENGSLPVEHRMHSEQMTSVCDKRISITELNTKYHVERKFTTPSSLAETVYFTFTLNSCKILIENLQLELGDTATAYENFVRDGEIISTSTVDVDYDHTIYARWTPNKFNISFNPNGGTGEMANMECDYDQTYTLTKNAFTREGYTFAGWSTLTQNATVRGTYGTDEDGSYITKKSTDQYSYSTSIYLPNIPVKAGKTYTWSIEVYPVDYAMRRQMDANVTCNEASGNDAGYYNHLYGGNYTLPANTWSVVTMTLTITEGFTNTKNSSAVLMSTFADGTNVIGSGKDVKVYYRNSMFYEVNNEDGYFADEATVKNLATSGTVTMNAIWKPNTYKVKYDPNVDNGGVGSPIESSDLVYDISYNLLDNTFTGATYEYKFSVYGVSDKIYTGTTAPRVFLGWSTNPQGSVEYTNKESIRELSSINGETVILYAIWDVVKLPELPAESNTEFWNLSAKYLNDGYEFLGWSTQYFGDESNVIGLPGDVWTGFDTTANASTRIIYTCYSANSVNVIYHANGGGFNLLVNSDFEDTTTNDSLKWDYSLNGNLVANSGWDSGWNAGVESPTIGYHAHLEVIDNNTNTVLRFKTNEGFAGDTDDYNGKAIPANRWLGMSQTIDRGNADTAVIKAGHTYMLTMDVNRLVGSGYVRAGLHYKRTSSDTKAFYAGKLNYKPTVNGEWQTITKTFKLTDEYYYDAVLYIYGHESGSGNEFLVDNVVLVDITETTEIEGITLKTVQEKYDSPYSMPAVYRLGYEFLGWTTSPSGGTPISSSTNISSIDGHNLYAKWNINQHKIKLIYTVDGNVVDPTEYDFSTNINVGGTINSETGEYTGGRLIENVIVETSADYGTNFKLASVNYNNKQFDITFDGAAKTLTSDMEFTIAFETKTYTLTIKYGAVYANSVHPTDLTLAVSGGTLDATTIAYDNSTNLVSTYSDSGITLTVTRANALRDYYVAINDNEGTVANEINSATFTWIPNENFTIAIHVRELFTVTAEEGTGVSEALVKTDWLNSTNNYYESTIDYQGAGVTFKATVEDGYTFDGWYDADGNKVTMLNTSETGNGDIESVYCINVNSEGGVGLRKDLTLTAQATPNTYTVTLDANGGKVGKVDTATIDVTYTEKYNLPTPTRDGYTFAGWYTESGSKITSSSTVQTASDHTLVARWNPNTYTITYKSNIENVDDVVQTVTYGEKFTTKPSNLFSNLGYSFVQWSVNDSEEDGDYMLPDTEYIYNTVGNTVVYAIWEADEIIEPENWVGGTMTITLTVEMGEIWVASLELEGGSGSFTYEIVDYNSDRFTFANTFGVSTPVSTSDAVHLWLTAGSVGTYKCKVKGTDNNNGLTTTSGEFKVNVVYPELVLNDETIHRSVYPKPNSTTVYNGSQSSVESSIYTPTARDGYTFLGWFTLLGTKVINADTTLVAGVEGWTTDDGKWALEEATQELYEGWKKNTYTVIINIDDSDYGYYNGNVATKVVTISNVEHGSTVAIDGYKVSVNGEVVATLSLVTDTTGQYKYNFDGWTVNGTAKPTTSTVTIVGSTTVTAHISHEVNKYTVYFELHEDCDGYGYVRDNNGEISSVTVDYGTKVDTATILGQFNLIGDSTDEGIVITAEPKNTSGVADDGYNYKFDSWINAPSVITQDVTVTVVFTRSPKEYTIEYCNIDGAKFGNSTENPNPETYTIEDDDITLINPTMSGYTFAGWLEGESTEPKTDVTITSGSIGDKTFTAVWLVDINIENINANGNTGSVVVYDKDGKLIGTHEDSFQLIKDETYILNVTTDLTSNSSTNSYEIVKIRLNDSEEGEVIEYAPNKTSVNSTIFNSKLTSALNITFAYYEAYMLTVSSPSGTVKGISVDVVEKGDNLVLQHENSYVVSVGTNVTFTVDSSSADIETALYTFIGFNYVANGTTKTVGVSGGTDIKLNDFDHDQDSVNTDIGIYYYTINASSKVTSLTLDAILSTSVSLSTGNVESGTVTITSSHGINKVIDKDTTSVILYEGTWTVTKTDLTLAEIEEIFKNCTVTQTGSVITIKVG